MRRGELEAELERLGSLPVPLPDRRWVASIEHDLYRDFVIPSRPAGRSARAVARHRRRQIVVIGTGLTAAATLAVAVLHRSDHPALELQTATGAVALLPDGQTQALQPGDEIPPGGLIQTGPAGSVTIGGTKVGPDQMVLVGNEGLTLLPAPTTGVPAFTAPAEEPPASTAERATPRTSPTPTPDPAPVMTPTATSSASAPPSVTDPGPMLAVAPLPTIELMVGEENGGVHLSWTPVEAESFDRYAVVRGTTETKQLLVIAELADRQITSFTDPAAPHGVELLYRVVAMAIDGRPMALSAIVQVALPDVGTTTSLPSGTDPSGSSSTTEPSGSILSIPTTSEPPSTEPTTMSTTSTAVPSSTTSTTSSPSTAPTTATSSTTSTASTTSTSAA